MKRAVVVFSGSILILLIIISCSLKMPGAPIWTIEVTVPFSQRTYRLAELITDSVKFNEDKYGLMYGQDGVILEFTWEDSIEYKKIGDSLMTYNASDVERYSNAIDTIFIELSQTDTSFIHITDFLPDSLIGRTGIIREFDLPPTENTLRYNAFRWIDVLSGWIVFRVENNFPCPVDSITLSLFNSHDDSFIGSLLIPGPILDDSYVIDSLNISDRIVYNEIRMIFEGHAMGTYRTRTVTGEEDILVIYNMTETSAQAANAEIQEQHFTVLDTLDYNDPNKLVEAIVSHGRVHLELKNNMPLRLSTKTYFLNIFTPDNEVLVEIATLEPGSIENPSTASFSTDLTDYRLVMSLVEQAVFARSEVTTEDTRITRYQGSTFQTITSIQGIIGNYWTDTLYFKEFTGVIYDDSLEISRHVSATRLPDEVEDIDFVADTLFLYMNNCTTVPLLLRMDVEANNSHNGRNSSISFSDYILPGLDTIRVPDADKLITILPNTISYYGRAFLGARYFPEYSDSIVTLTTSDSVGGIVSLRAEWKITSNIKTLTSDPVRLEKTLDYPVESVKLNITLVNSIPLSGSIKLLMGADTSDMTTLIEIDIPHGTIVNHRAQAVHRTFDINLGEAEFNIIKLENVYTQQILEFHGTEGDTVWLYGADSLDVQATATINYIVDPGDNYDK